jgi:hypothetical protein
MDNLGAANDAAFSPTQTHLTARDDTEAAGRHLRQLTPPLSPLRCWDDY